MFLYFLFAFIILISLHIYFQNKHNKREGFQDPANLKTMPKFHKIIYDNHELYDDFYANIYPKLFPSQPRATYEFKDINTNAIIPYTQNNSKQGIHILDVGCGQGIHTKIFNDNQMRCVGIDYSNSMINYGKQKYGLKSNTLHVGDVSNEKLYSPNTFSHIICMYFSFYYYKHPEKVISNIRKWLRKGGYFVVHLVDREKFDPILEPASPFPAFSKQKYSKERITKSEIEFNNLSYEAKFTLNKDEDRGYLQEIFRGKKDDYSRKQTHTFYMKDHEEIVDEIKNHGFEMIHVTHLLNAEYEYQYLYYFRCLK
jgi:ubiquinone/menaquinone biosynthesis C-methylase UbiE